MMSVEFFWFLVVGAFLFEGISVGMIAYWSLKEGWDTPEHIEIPDESPEELRKVIMISAAFVVIALIIILLGS